MLKKYIIIFLMNFFVLTFSQTINIEGKQLNIGMEKSITLDIMHEYLGQENYDSSHNNFWLQNDDVIIVPAVTDEEAKKLFGKFSKIKPYLRYTKIT